MANVTIRGFVRWSDDQGRPRPIENASVSLYFKDGGRLEHIPEARSRADGSFELHGRIEDGHHHTVRCTAFDRVARPEPPVIIGSNADQSYDVSLTFPFEFRLKLFRFQDDGSIVEAEVAKAGETLLGRFESNVEPSLERPACAYHWRPIAGARIINPSARETAIIFLRPGERDVSATIADGNGATAATSRPVLAQLEQFGGGFHVFAQGGVSEIK